MRNPLSAFARWRLTSDLWLYWMLVLGVLCLTGGVAVALDLALELLVWAAVPAGEPWPWSYPWLAVGLLGAGAFVLVFEVGVVDLLLTARQGLRQRRTLGDPELYERMLRWQKDRRRLKDKFK